MKKVPFRQGLFTIPSSSSEKPCLLGSRCRTCQEVTFPQKQICPNCFGDDVKPVALSTRGKLFTFTITYQGPKEFSVPYACGYIDLPEGVRLYSLITDWTPERLKIGMDMELGIEKIREDSKGNEVFGYTFRPV